VRREMPEHKKTRKKKEKEKERERKKEEFGGSRMVSGL
jgi:hypothetical protein